MPCYFFDIDDGVRITVDEEGSVMRDLHDVRAEAIGVLPDVAREVLPDGDHHTLKVSVRNEAGRVVYRAVLTLDAGQTAPFT